MNSLIESTAILMLLCLLLIFFFFRLIKYKDHLEGEIIERKRAEEALRESEAKYKTLIENSPDSIARFDQSLRYVFINNKVVEELEKPIEDLLGKTNRELGMPEDVLKIWEAGLQAVFQTKQKQNIDIEYNTLHGPKHYTSSIVPEFNKDNEVHTILSITRDITERKQAEEALIKYKDHLEVLVEDRTAELDKALLIAKEANRAKSEFLANMSHEIRTPLSSIIGFSELLFDEVTGPLNDDQKKYLDYVTSSGQHLLSLINDILDLSKVEAGKMELLPTSFSIRDLLKNSLSYIAEQTIKHNIRLLSEFSADVDMIEADERKVKQILFNLLSNAVKFTPDGGSITVGADIVSLNSAALPMHIRKDLSDTEYVLVSVKDTGIGIAKKDQSKLFTEFHQLENPYTKKYEGTGLGLALSKRLVTLHEGKIWFESQGKGKGCTFYFVLPINVRHNKTKQSVS